MAKNTKNKSAVQKNTTLFSFLFPIIEFFVNSDIFSVEDGSQALFVITESFERISFENEYRGQIYKSHKLYKKVCYVPKQISTENWTNRYYRNIAIKCIIYELINLITMLSIKLS